MSVVHQQPVFLPIPAPSAGDGNGGVNAQNVFVYVQSPGRTGSREHLANNYPLHIVKVLAVAQIVVAGIAFITQVRSLLQHNYVIPSCQFRSDCEYSQQPLRGLPRHRHLDRSVLWRRRRPRTRLGSEADQMHVRRMD